MGYGIYRHKAGIIVGTLALQSISSLFIGLRFYTRYWRKQVILSSDWVVLIAFICATGLSVLEIYGVVEHGFGTPLMATNPKVQGLSEKLRWLQHMEYGFVITGAFAVGMVKLSVSLLYYHLFAAVRFRHFLIVWIVVIIAWTITFVAGELLECGARPLKVFGSAADVAKYCPNIHLIGYAMVGSDIGTDLITLLIPLPLVLRMRLPRTQKILVTATFCVGALAVGASTTKAYVYISASLKLTKEDGAILLTAYSMWNLVEVHVCIIAACAITLRPIFTRIFRFNHVCSLFRSWIRSWERSDLYNIPSTLRSDQTRKGRETEVNTTPLPEVV